MDRVLWRWCRDYERSGARDYKRRQTKRLIAIIDWCNANRLEIGGAVDCISRRDLIAYWDATKHESDKVRVEKYRILKAFFESGVVRNPPRVPFPRIKNTQFQN